MNRKYHLSTSQVRVLKSLLDGNVLVVGRPLDVAIMTSLVRKGYVRARTEFGPRAFQITDEGRREVELWP